MICAEEHISVQWMGVSGLSKSGAPHRNDYERACSTQEYLEAMTCAVGYVLVLGDEPLQSSFLSTESGDLAIARWVSAQSSEGVEKFLTGHVADGSDLAPGNPFRNNARAIGPFRLRPARVGCACALPEGRCAAGFIPGDDGKMATRKEVRFYRSQAAERWGLKATLGARPHVDTACLQHLREEFAGRFWACIWTSR